MIRVGLSAVLGFILFYIESLIVMDLKGMQTIQFEDVASFVNIWAMNFFFVFTILTHVGIWFQNKGLLGNDKNNPFYR